jgi:hypothetical protein
VVIQIELEPDEEQALVERARLSGRDPVQYARLIIRDHIGSPFPKLAREGTAEAMPAPEDLIDHEFIADCARQHCDDVPTIEKVRKVLSKIPGSLAEEIIADREDRF